MGESGSFETEIRNLVKGRETVFDILRETGDDGKEIRTVTLRHEPVKPERVEAPITSHVFHTTESMIDYLTEYGGEDTVVYVDFVSRQIKAVLDESSPHEAEVVTMMPSFHPLFQPWADHLGHIFPIADFIEFISRNRKTIIQPNFRDLRIALSQIRASVSKTLDRGQGTNSINGVRVEIKVKGAGSNETTKDLVEIPEIVMVRAPIFIGTEPRDVEIDLLLVPKGEEIYAQITSGDMAVKIVECFEEMTAALKEADPKFTVVMGAPGWKDWTYIK